MRRRAQVALAAAWLLAGCAPRCPLGQRTELYFGLRRPDGSVVARGEFEAFLSEATHTLPDGFTLYEAEGRWQGGNTEPSHVLVVLHRGEPQIDVGLERLRALYKMRFAQQSVLRADAPVCARP